MPTLPNTIPHSVRDHAEVRLSLGIRASEMTNRSTIGNMLKES